MKLRLFLANLVLATSAAAGTYTAAPEPNQVLLATLTDSVPYFYSKERGWVKDLVTTNLSTPTVVIDMSNGMLAPVNFKIFKGRIENNNLILNLQPVYECFVFVGMPTCQMN